MFTRAATPRRSTSRLPRRRAAGGCDGPPPAHVSEDTRVAVEIRTLVEHGDMDEARERFGELVTFHQRRASRIAYQYLRDAAEADEAVQDAFVKVFSHITSYREAWPFEVWFTRILINGCLDRRKARARRDRWFVGSDVIERGRGARPAAGRPPDPEHRAAVARAPRQAHRRPSTGWTAGSGRSSCCATTATARRARSAP